MTNTLHRRLGTPGAVAIGLGAMLGAGVFSVFTPAAGAAGAALPLAVVLAALVAVLNATATAQLARQYPVAGGAYVYGRKRLGEWPGFLAGWGFLIGKTASCAAIAWTLGAYALPGHERWVALAAVAVLTLLALGGVTRTAGASMIIAGAVILALLAVIALGWAGVISGRMADGAAAPLPSGGTWYGVLQAAGLVFFAFAGYARVATLGEEVVDPARTIPRAIAISLSVVLVIYLALAVLLDRALGADLATALTPIADLIAPVLGTGGEVAVRIVATVACAGSLLALMAGISRTTVAMGRTGDLPRAVARISDRGVPTRAELLVGVVVAAAVLTVDLRGMVAFSSFGVLLYYAVANLAAFTQAREDRFVPRAVNAVGALLCGVLVVTLPLSGSLVGLGVLALGVGWRLLTRSRAPRRAA
ncbi:APC family permease [Serinibacter salmoneus]|uniref:APC family permease n=1 Tax=Serinibacter salmoneus TaxID=556530 RepID=UPI001FEB6F2D|nr:APC family permease [Serinibacter salmoneus]